MHGRRLRDLVAARRLTRSATREDAKQARAATNHKLVEKDGEEKKIYVKFANKREKKAAHESDDE